MTDLLARKEKTYALTVKFHIHVNTDEEAKALAVSKLVPDSFPVNVSAVDIVLVEVTSKDLHRPVKF